MTDRFSRDEALLDFPQGEAFAEGAEFPYEQDGRAEWAEATATEEGGPGEWSEAELQYSIIVSPTSPGDDRFKIPARTKRPSSLQFPFNTVCLLERTRRSGAVSRVSGTLIAPQVVLTARHCLVSKPADPIVRIRVVPGADLSAGKEAHRRPASPPIITAERARFRVHGTLDYGVIVLPRPFARPNRYMVLQPRSTPRVATLLTVAGYPCDKPKGTMWGHSEQIPLASITATHLKYPLDTCPGHSGSPLWLLGNDEIRLLLGVHTSGVAGARCFNDPTGKECHPPPVGGAQKAVKGLNTGVRVTCDVIRQIRKWCAEFKVRGPLTDSEFRRACGG